MTSLKRNTKTDPRSAADERIFTEARSDEHIFIVAEIMWEDPAQPHLGLLPVYRAQFKDGILKSVSQKRSIGGKMKWVKPIEQLHFIDEKYLEEFEKAEQHQRLMAFRLAEKCLRGNIVVAKFDHEGYVISFRVEEWRGNYPSRCFGPQYSYLIKGELCQHHSLYEKDRYLYLRVRQTKYVDWKWNTEDVDMVLVFGSQYKGRLELDFLKLKGMFVTDRIVIASGYLNGQNQIIVEYFGVEDKLPEGKLIADKPRA